MFDWSYIENRIASVETACAAFPKKQEEILQKTAVYQPAVIEGMIADLKAELTGTANRAFDECKESARNTLALAETAAKRPDVPFDERTYYATAVGQDIEGLDADGILAVYPQVVKEGPRARQLEFERLADPRVKAAGTGYHQQFAAAKWAALNDAERTAAKVRLGLESLEHGIETMRSTTASMIEGGNGSMVLAGYLARIRQNVEKAAESASRV